MGLEPVTDLLAQQAFGKLEYDDTAVIMMMMIMMMYLEDERHGPGQVDEVDLPVPHRQGPLAAAERLGPLRRRPHGEVAPADGLFVEDVGEAAHLDK